MDHGLSVMCTVTKYPCKFYVYRLIQLLSFSDFFLLTLTVSGGDSGSAGVSEITKTLESLASNPNVQGNDVLQTLVQTMSKVCDLSVQELFIGIDVTCLYMLDLANYRL